MIRRYRHGLTTQALRCPRGPRRAGSDRQWKAQRHNQGNKRHPVALVCDLRHGSIIDRLHRQAVSDAVSLGCGLIGCGAMDRRIVARSDAEAAGADPVTPRDRGKRASSPKRRALATDASNQAEWVSEASAAEALRATRFGVSWLIFCDDLQSAFQSGQGFSVNAESLRNYRDWLAFSTYSERVMHRLTNVLISPVRVLRYLGTDWWPN
jgi:hypothetical protein